MVFLLRPPPLKNNTHFKFHFWINKEARFKEVSDDDICFSYVYRRFSRLLRFRIRCLRNRCGEQTPPSPPRAFPRSQPTDHGERVLTTSEIQGVMYDFRRAMSILLRRPMDRQRPVANTYAPYYNIREPRLRSLCMPWLDLSRSWTHIFFPSSFFFFFFFLLHVKSGRSPTRPNSKNL